MKIKEVNGPIYLQGAARFAHCKVCFECNTINDMLSVHCKGCQRPLLKHKAYSDYEVLSLYNEVKQDAKRQKKY